MEWHIIDAFNLAMDMYEHGEITLDEIDKTTQTLWEEMQEETEESL